MSWSRGCENGVLDPGEACLGRTIVLTSTSGDLVFERAPSWRADLDGDGIDEIIVAGSRGYSVFESGRNGYREAWRSETIALSKPLFEDANQDGHLDLVAVLTSSIVLWPGRPDGSFSESEAIPLPLPIQASARIQMGDLDGDGRRG